MWVELLPGLWEGRQPTPEEADMLRIRIGNSGLPQSTAITHRFSGWKHVPELEEAYRLVYDFATRKLPHHFLTLIGPKGTGKTHLAIAVAWSWLEYLGVSVSYRQVETLLEEMRRGFNKKDGIPSESAEALLNFHSNCSLLILDDLGAESVTEWAWSKLDSIVDFRYIHKKHLIVTSNVAPDRLPPRIADRLFEGQVVILKGESYRRRQHNESNLPTPR